MLKAYDYAEQVERKKELKDAYLFRREKQIAGNYVISHPLRKEKHFCPICGSERTGYIFERWDVDYEFCEACDSIFVPVDFQTIEGYLNLEEMKELRISDEYQTQAMERREDIWMEVVLWVEYRAYRYLGRNKELDIIDYGNRYRGYVELFRKSMLTKNYELRNSILPETHDRVEKADVVLYLNQLQHERTPVESLEKIRESLKEDGILILSTRLGSGFDILTLKGGTDSIFPYEHVMLPSKKGLKLMLEKAGFELLEITTPGTRDMEEVLKNKDRIEENNFFVRYLLDTADASTMADFQQFLQKSGLSSFAQAVARRKR